MMPQTPTPLYSDGDLRTLAYSIAREWMHDINDHTVRLVVEDGDFDAMARRCLNAVAPAIAARALRNMAERTIAETVCCDEYERTVGGLEPRPRVPHHICYWGAAHAKALRALAAEIENP